MTCRGRLLVNRRRRNRGARVRVLCLDGVHLPERNLSAPDPLALVDTYSAVDLDSLDDESLLSFMYDLISLHAALSAELAQLSTASGAIPTEVS